LKCGNPENSRDGNNRQPHEETKMDMVGACFRLKTAGMQDYPSLLPLKPKERQTD
jgi:hypothetical protein